VPMRVDLTKRTKKNYRNRPSKKVIIKNRSYKSKKKLAHRKKPISKRKESSNYFFHLTKKFNHGLTRYIEKVQIIIKPRYVSQAKKINESYKKSGIATCVKNFLQNYTVKNIKKHIKKVKADFLQSLKNCSSFEDRIFSALLRLFPIIRRLC